MQMQNKLWQVCKNAGIADPGVFPLSIDCFVVRFHTNEVTIAQLFQVMADMRKVESVISVGPSGDWNSVMLMANMSISPKVELIVTFA